MATVDLRPMLTQSDIQHYLRYTIDEYGAAMHVAGEYPTPAASLRASSDEINSYYNNPRPHKAHYPFFIYAPAENANVGMLVVSSLERSKQVVAFIDYIGIYESYRRKGYAFAGMQLIEPFVKEKNLPAIELNVLIQRLTAQAMYKKLGYYEKRRWIGGYAQHITRVDMRKDL